MTERTDRTPPPMPKPELIPMSPLRSKTATIDIYIKLAQYPILADKIRARMREELFERGIVAEQKFEAEVRDRAIESQKREGLYDPFNHEPASLWQKRKGRIRDFHTDFYYGHNFPISQFEELVQSVLNTQPRSDAHVELSFNPELAPWSMLFQQGEIFEKMVTEKQGQVRHHLEEIKVVLIKGMISDHLRFIGVAKRVLTIADLRRIYNRRIGEGKIGGKAAGMVVAWKILKQNPTLADRVEIPQSYFIGSEVTYDFRRLNGLDQLMNQKYRPLEEIRAEYPAVVEAHLKGEFPKEIVDQLREVLDMMGNTPIIVRSSSLLEDNFGFSFAGKYDSFFCPNQGTAEENLRDLLDAIRRTYASTLNPNAILYRQKHGLIDYDERMAILLQEVRGQTFNGYYFPTVAGVGFSQNDHRWHEKIRRNDGFLRLVWGMGTRAVDRVSHDYPRMIALSHPHLRPETTARAIRQYSQHYIDVIDLEANDFKTLPVDELLTKKYPFTKLLASVDEGDFLRPIMSNALLKKDDHLVLTFEQLTKDQVFANLLRTAMQELEEKYGIPVDTEFTIEVRKHGRAFDYILHLLQCRPLSQREEAQPIDIPDDLEEEWVLFRSQGLVPNGKVEGVRYIVFIDPAVYKKIPDMTTKLELGRAVSRLNYLFERDGYVLMGPGRWGSSNIDLGVRVTYADIHNTRILVEIAVSDGGAAPELSYGTHFFQDLVEAGIHSLPLHLTNEKPHTFQWNFFHNSPNHLAELLPDDASLEPYMRVLDVLADHGRVLDVYMDGRRDRTVGVLARPQQETPTLLD